MQIDIDQRKACALGVSIDDINDTLQTARGSSYVNDFMDRGRVKKVYVQAAAKYRMLPDDINLWYVRNNNGGMVPFSAFATSRWETGSPRLNATTATRGRDCRRSRVRRQYRYSDGHNGIAGAPVADRIRPRMDCDVLSGTAVGFSGPALYAISLLVVFLCLAALYESWSVPSPSCWLCRWGSLVLCWRHGCAVWKTTCTSVGLLTVIGLSAKNAILIVEFANEMNEKGHDLLDATLHACRQRLRPILMTSLAFIFGVLPMTISSGAGSGGQHAVGTGVMGGMISATITAIYFVPCSLCWYADASR